VVPLAIFAALGGLRLARLVDHKIPVGVAAALTMLVAVAPCYSRLVPSAYTTVKPRQLEFVLSPLSQGLLPRDGGILSRWDSGHHARYYAGLPVVASPFGTDGGEGAMEDTAAFFLETDAAAAKQLLKRRQIKYVLLSYHPANSVVEAVTMLKPDPPPLRVLGDRYSGYRVQVTDDFNRLIISRLYIYMGMADIGQQEILGGFRLVSEVGPRGGIPDWRLFEVVEWAKVVVTGARPGTNVTVSTRLTTPLGTMNWETGQPADAAGKARFRLPYATGLQGRVTADPYQVSDGVKHGKLVVPNLAVETGGEILLSLESVGS